MEPGETFHAAAKRELYEETGYYATRLEYLFGGPSTPETYTYCFIHTGSLPDQPKQGDEKTLWGTWDQMFESKFGGYYRILCDVAARRRD